ncbi:MAG: hypothetical protein C0601_00685 [Candidatus Muiribacterium halophilum]|uniref:Nif11 domain-containing protein n=1 Tax=Muiribacterium halophilum TaxID=2053465 RepID=A0A2N5ZMJ5_MUIH1|nr:MAG: hypothetical protein C0601_00685 [Candidatus Muirbacterium halophilum]
MKTNDFFKKAKHDKILKEKLIKCESATDIRRLGAEHGFDLSESEIEAYLCDFLKDSISDIKGELTDEELNQIVGGLSPQTGNAFMLLGKDFFSLVSKLLNKL